MTSVDVFDDSVRVRVLFSLPADAAIDANSYEAARRKIPWNRPGIEVGELANAFELTFLMDRLGDHQVVYDDVSAAAVKPAGRGSQPLSRGGVSGGVYGRRTLMETITVPLASTPKALTLVWAATRITLAIPESSSDSADG